MRSHREINGFFARTDDLLTNRRVRFPFAVSMMNSASNCSVPFLPLRAVWYVRLCVGMCQPKGTRGISCMIGYGNKSLGVNPPDHETYSDYSKILAKTKRITPQQKNIDEVRRLGGVGAEGAARVLQKELDKQWKELGPWEQTMRERAKPKLHAS
jgi:hypothetical protein